MGRAGRIKVTDWSTHCHILQKDNADVQHSRYVSERSNC